MSMDEKRRRPLRGIVLAAVLVVAGYPVLAAALSGYGWRESDWNGDGRTTLGEWFQGMDVGTDDIVIDGQRCTEYFEMKSANTIRVDCPAPG